MTETVAQQNSNLSFEERCGIELSATEKELEVYVGKKVKFDNAIQVDKFFRGRTGTVVGFVPAVETDLLSALLDVWWSELGIQCKVRFGSLEVVGNN